MLNANRNLIWIVISIVLLGFLPVEAAAESELRGTGDISAAAAEAPGDPQYCDRSARHPSTGQPIQVPTSWRRLHALSLLGQCYQVKGDLQAAARYFRQGLREDAVLTSQWRIKLLRVLVAQHDAEEAPALIGEIFREEMPGARDEVRALLLAALGNTATDSDPALHASIAAYLDAVQPKRDDYDLAAALLKAATRSTVANPQAGTGRDHLIKLLWTIPRDRETAASSAQAAAARDFKAKAALSPEHLARRIENLHRSRLYEFIRDEARPSVLSAVLSADQPAVLSAVLSAMSPKLAKTVGRRYFNALQRKRAYRQALDELAQPEVRRLFAMDEADALVLEVDFQMKARRYKAALKTMARLEEVAPRSVVLPGFYLEWARRARRGGRWKEMRRWCLQIIEDFPRARSGGEAYWMLLWHHYKRGEDGEAARWASAALARGARDADAPRFLYWLSRIQARQGDDEAAKGNRQILRKYHLLSYYGLLADGESLDRSAMRVSNGESRPASGDNDPPELSAVWREAELSNGLLLMAFGEANLGAAALRAGMGKPFPQRALRELADILHYMGQFHLLQRLSVSYFLGSVSDGGDPDDSLMRYVFPLAYPRLVWRASGDQGMDPFFVTAVMREESRFRADADSIAGAKGLMQLMPATAKMIAGWNNKRFAQDALMNPETNVAYGVQYLRWLSRKFKGNPVHVAAAYNAGPGAASVWIKRKRALDDEEFIEEIPFQETQNYVKKVLRSTMIYHRLYGKDAAAGGSSSKTSTSWPTAFTRS